MILKCPYKDELATPNLKMCMTHVLLHSCNSPSVDTSKKKKKSDRRKSTFPEVTLNLNRNIESTEAIF